MSNIPPHDPQYAFRDDSASFPDTQLAKRRNTLPLVILGGGCVVALICVGAGIFFAIRSQTGHARVAVAPQQSLDAKIAESVAAYSAPLDDVAPVVPPEIAALLNRAAAATRRQDHAAFRALVDRDRLFARVRSAAPIGRADVFQQIAWKREIYESLEADSNWYRYRVASVVPVAGVPDNVIVYAYCWNVHDEPVEVRWWLAKADGEWRIYDWERLDFGLPQSRDWALHLRYQHDYRLAEYYDGNQQMMAAENRMRQGDYEEAQDLLRRAAQCTLPPELEDFRLTMLGYDWRGAGGTRESLECLERVTNPRATPGAYYGQAVCYQELGLHRKALEFATLYETHVGPVPDLCAVQARSLAALGRESEAAAAWRKVLAVEPDDREALRSWAVALTDSEQGHLVGALERTSDPAAAAIDLAGAFSERGDAPALQAIRGFIERTAPESPHVIGVSGMLLSVDREYERAADRFQQARDKATDQPTRSTYRYRYLSAMADAGKYLDAYQSAPDPDDTFLHFAAGYEDGETDLNDEEFGQLVDAHRRRRPADPWGDYYAARLLEGKPEAEQILRDALEKADGEDYVVQSLRDELASVLCEQHHVLEAYRTIEPADERFRQLANLCRWDQRQEDLRELIAAHRRASPDDPWIAFHEAWLLESNGKLDKAIELYRQCRERIGKEDYAVRSALVSAYVKADRWEDAYRDAESPEAGFGDLAGRLVRADQQFALEVLLALHAAECPDDPVLLSRTMDSYWDRQQYQQLLDFVAAQDPMSLRTLPFWQRSDIWFRATRSHLRLGRPAEAKALATRLFEEEELLEPLLLVHAAAGDVAETRRWLAEYVRINRWHSWIYQDEDIGRILWTDKFRSLREEYPPNPPYARGDTVAVFLLDEPIDDPAAELSARLSELAGADADVWLPLSPPGEPQFVVRTGATTIWGVACSGQYCAEESWWDGIESDALREKAERHTAYMAIGYATPFDGDEPDDRVSLKLGSRLAGDHALAVCWGEDARIIDGDELTGWARSDQEPLSQIGERGEAIPALYPTDDQPADRELRRVFDRRLFAAARSFEGEQPQPLEVCFRLRSGLFYEPLWLRVVRVEQDDSIYRFAGPLQNSSRLLPTWSAGEYVELREYEVVAVKSPDGDTPVVTERWPGATERLIGE